MYCRNCGKLVLDGDRFCSNCGAKIAVSEETTHSIDDFEPAFKSDGDVKKPAEEAEPSRRKFHIEEMNWDLEGYPTEQKQKTEDIDFNWESVMEEKQRRIQLKENQKNREVEDKALDIEERPQEENQEKPQEAAEEEIKWAFQKPKEEPEKSLEEELFAQAEKPYESTETDDLEKTTRIDKFYTFNKKNEEFQQLLDQEYERIKRGESKQEEEKPVNKEAKVAEFTEKVVEAEEAPSKEEDDNAVAVVLAEAPKGYVTEGCQVACPPSSEGNQEATEEKDNQAEGEGNKTESFEENPEHKLTFGDVFAIDDNDEEEKPKKKSKVLKVIAVILVILIALELAILGIKYFAPNSSIAQKIDSAYASIVNMISGDTGEDPSSQITEQSAIAQLITEHSAENKNIGAVVENTSLTFDSKKTYDFDTLSKATNFSDSAWYTNEDGKTVSYGDTLIETLIQYYSSWVDKANGKSDDVLKYIKSGTSFYDEISNLETTEEITYGINKLEIGKIKSADTDYYIITQVTKTDSKSNKETTSKQVVYMKAENKTMQIIKIKEI